MTVRKLITALIVPLLVVLAGGGLAACSSSDDADGTQSSQVKISDQWVKAAPDGMTSAFAKVRNNGKTQVRIVSASSDVAGSTQLHEVVTENGVSTMKEKADGYVVGAGKTLDLTPGGAHIMLMDLRRPIAAGDLVTIQLVFADGSMQTVSASARDFAGNQEDYGNAPAASSTMPSMSMTMDHSHH
ncbi:MAG: copper chaperone PCu(A)C [Gordonia sp. (in: high G+C Gram-positive bacteria)]|uniref:copper chaperone PCu(A)C n=1 Tax=Gordonia sp. (in: high G+C Gram-positive bacteria) TaxID=84139 RepID=UPI0039E51309